MYPRAWKFIGAAIVLVGAGFLLGWSVQAPSLDQADSAQKDGKPMVHLMIDEDTGKLQTFPNEHFFAGQTVFDILKTVTTRETLPFIYDPPGSYGVFMRQIGAKKNGEGKKYWQYWVNGQFAMVAADRYTLNSGDTIVWKFTHE